MAALQRPPDAPRLDGGWAPAQRSDSRLSAASAPAAPLGAAAAAAQSRQAPAGAAAPPRRSEDDGSGGLEARWRAALYEVQQELELERASRQEAELVLADTTQALSALREQSARAATAAAAAVLSGAAPPAGAQEAVALLREQLRLREAELATLRGARPGACSRCAEVALALAAHPAFRPRTGGAADWEAWDARGGGGDAGGGGRSGAAGALASAAAAVASAPPRAAAAAAAAWLWLALLDAAALPLLASYAAALLCAGRASAPPGARPTLVLGGVLATLAATLLLCLRSARLAAAAAAYVAWASLADGAPRRGGRPYAPLRRARLWRHLAAARRVTLHKTGDLDPSARHVIALAPAGHVSPAALLAFSAPRAAGFAAAFGPRLDCRVCAPPGAAALALPLLREGLLAMGVADGGETGLEGTLLSSLSATAVVPIPLPGGPPAAAAPPAAFDAAAAARRRVARAALRTGAAVVPAYAFGDCHESELPPSAAAAATRFLGVAPPGVSGALWPAAAALAAAAAPWLPPAAAAVLRRFADALAPAAPLGAAGVRIVVGTPFACPRVPHPTDALVDDVAARLWRETAALVTAHAAPDDARAPQ